jgi:hypothetical protein
VRAPHTAYPLTPLPPVLTAVNLHAWTVRAFDLCGCEDVGAVVATVYRALGWFYQAPALKIAPPRFYPAEPGVFPILAARLEALGLTEHKPRYTGARLTDDGMRLFLALKQVTPTAIAGARGEAYDGLYYGYEDAEGANRYVCRG